MKSYKYLALVTFLALSVTGCAKVGPDYHAPQSTIINDFEPNIVGGVALENGQEIAQWWKSFNDPLLDELIEKAVDSNTDLRIALARVNESRARLGIAESDRYPNLDAGATVYRERSGYTDTTQTTHSAGFDAGWEIDLFGRVARQVEAADAEMSASIEDLKDVQVTLIAEVARTYVTLRTYQERLRVAGENMAVQQETFSLISSLYEAGLSDELAMQQARYNLENTRGQIPTFRAGVIRTKNQLSTLIGVAPGGLDTIFAQQVTVPEVPVSVVIGVPAETLRQRPDIRQAERRLAAQSARIGVAESELYPRLRLMGSIGLESLDSSDFFSSDNQAWGIGPAFSWRIFDAGAVRRNIEVQTAIEEQFLASYEQTVLKALEEVQTSLTDYAEEQIRKDHLEKAVEAARRAELLARERYTAGLVDFSNVLDAQRSLLQYQDALVIASGEVTGNLVRIYKALGGGWEYSPTA